MSGDASDALAAGLLATDFYQLTMLHAYYRAGMKGTAVFEFFCRHLPPNRGFLLTAGLGTLLDRLEDARFNHDEIAWLHTNGHFPFEIIDRFAAWRFTGDIDAMPEGTLAFSDEPMLRVTAPIAEAQLIETLVINHIHFQTLVASKAARMVLSAPGAKLIDFGLRRAHSLEAGTYAARAAHIAGFTGTATVSAGKRFGIPLSGTMAHSFVQAHDDEAQAFLDFAEARPEGVILLIDTYDTEVAAHKVVELADKLHREGIAIRGVRIDSGDLAAHARTVRNILDRGGLHEVEIVASGGLDEWKLRDLVSARAPIDAFGIGTSLTTSQDVPALDCAYKLVAYAGTPRRKRSEGKQLWPGAKQVHRRLDAHGRLDGDVLALAEEAADGAPLLQPVMRKGKRLDLPSIEESCALASASLASLSEELRDLDRPGTYLPFISPGLRKAARSLAALGR
jgi:nicotinate phosphoribosyltransferase